MSKFDVFTATVSVSRQYPSTAENLIHWFNDAERVTHAFFTFAIPWILLIFMSVVFSFLFYMGLQIFKGEHTNGNSKH